jgi:peptidoglycan/LPS O-acetylase OafA/YrhL
MNAHSDAVGIGSHPPERTPGVDYYRPDIDGLRAVAVLAVLGFHAFPDYFPGGFVGVDVFFVISGFLISSIILRQLRRSTFTLADFYSRRIRRIFPALMIVLVACLAFGWFALLPDELEHLGKHTAAAATFVSNFALWLESGYFDRAAELKPLLHLWSLGIEEQFYLVWPVLLLLLTKQRHNVAITVALLTAASFGLSVAVSQESPTANFYFPFSRFWELGLGCLLAVVRESPGSLTGWLREEAHRFNLDRIARDLSFSGLSNASWSSFAHSVLPVVGIGLIGAAIFLFNRDTTFPGWATLLPTVGAMCVIWARGDSWFQRRILACAGMVLIGVISYPLYLWHWPLLSFATILEAGTPDSIVRAVAVVLSIALAWLTFKFFEHPIRARRSTRVTWSLVGALAAFGVAGLAIHAASGFEDRFDLSVHAIRPGPRTNSLCVDNFPEDRNFNYCKSTSTAPPAAVFLGDSRTQSVYDGVADLMGSGYPMTLLARGGCPPLLNMPFQYSKEKDCDDVWNNFLDYVRGVKPPLVVIVGGGSTILKASVADPTMRDVPVRIREKAFRQGLAALVAALQRTSRVIYVRELPQFDSAPSCFLRRVRLPRSECAPTVDRSVVEEELASYNRVVDDVGRRFPDLEVVDSIPALCSARICSQQLKSGEILYSDELHLSPAGGRHFVRTSGLLTMMIDEMNLPSSG